MDSSEPHELTHYQAGENPLASGELRSARKAKHTVRHTVTNTKKAVAHTKKVQRRAGAVRSTSQRQKVRDICQKRCVNVKVFIHLVYVNVFIHLCI